MRTHRQWHEQMFEHPQIVNVSHGFVIDRYVDGVAGVVPVHFRQIRPRFAVEEAMN
jgi:hypothetical protein